MTLQAQPAHEEVRAFYLAAQPLVEQLAARALAWRTSASREALPAAIEAHTEFLALAIRVQLSLNRYRRGGAD